MTNLAIDGKSMCVETIINQTYASYRQYIVDVVYIGRDIVFYNL